MTIISNFSPFARCLALIYSLKRDPDQQQRIRVSVRFKKIRRITQIAIIVEEFFKKSLLTYIRHDEPSIVF